MNVLDVLYRGQPGVANTALYTCPANTRVRILAMTATNDAAVAAWMTVHSMPSGGAVGDTNLLINTKALGDKESYSCPEVVGHVLEAGDVLSAIVETADNITMVISGVIIV